MQGLALPLVAVLFGASTWAVHEDLRFHRISNRLTGSLLLSALTLQVIFGGWNGLWAACSGGLVAVLFPLYLLRATGAGDVKLLAAVGALLGPHWALLAGVYTLLAGGVLGLGFVAVGALRTAVSHGPMTWRQRVVETHARIHELRRARFPYALAIGCGALMSVWQRGDLAAAMTILSGTFA